ncbi:MAG: DUF4438 domain-containing protein [Proteobacteria bacterium]|nr:DUF4438 domain-containing protein [Desulfobacula sp.]MBU3953691.1 DUF4438 domain-containing protein [Pseudomonadota bacterium]MBU4133282.1 DUF4438 domain-containing protein [Pseudomonadota bacterium]
MLKTNLDKIVEMYLECRPGQPRVGAGWRVDHQGVPFLLPGIGGITLNVQVGDSAFGLAGDHIEPGVSCTANADKPNEFPNNSLQILSCVGNEARIVTGDAKGEKGIVIGHHGGSEHIIVDFSPAVKEKMTYDDRILIRAKGQGLALIDYPKIKLFNLSPDLLHTMKIVATDTGTLKVPVTTVVPAACMGSGVGRAHVGAGDYDVMTSDPATVQKYQLDKMRFGDIVALMDHDNSYGRAFVQGAVSIGILVHSDCRLAGHGPGISTLMTCPTSLIEPVIDPCANIADLLKIGTGRE